MSRLPIVFLVERESHSFEISKTMLLKRQVIRAAKAKLENVYIKPHEVEIL